MEEILNPNQKLILVHRLCTFVDQMCRLSAYGPHKLFVYEESYQLSLMLYQALVFLQICTTPSRHRMNSLPQHHNTIFSILDQKWAHFFPPTPFPYFSGLFTSRELVRFNSSSTSLFSFLFCFCLCFFLDDFESEAD